MKKIEFGFLKKLSAAFLPVCIMIAGALAFASCSDDDDNGNGGSSGGATTSINGKLLTKVGDCNFVYDEKNRLTKIYDYYDDFIEIDYSAGKAIMTEGEEAKLSFTKNGYISKISMSWTDKDDDYSEKGSGNISFTYDGNGHLTKVKMSSSVSGVEDGEKYSESYTDEYNFTWSNGNMTKVVENGVEKYDGEKEEYNSIYTYSYGSTDNAFRQYTKALVYPIDDGDWEKIAYAGLIGKSSAKLPSSVTEEYSYKGYNEPVDTDTENYNVSYTLNDDGSVKSEYFGRSTVNYYYAATTAEAKAIENTAFRAAKQSERKLSFRSLFKHRRK